MKNVIIAVLLSLCGTLLGSHIAYEDGAEKYKLLSKETGKIMNYYKLNPGEKLHIKAVDVIGFKLNSRIVYSSSSSGTYTYLLKYNGLDKEIIKTAKKSNVTRALDGSFVSSFNSVALDLKDYHNGIEVINNSREVLLLKASGDNSSNSSPDIEYINFYPDEFDREVNLMVKDKNYSYYSEKGNYIILNLDGPVLLKIVSRMLVDPEVKVKQKYHFKVLDNGKEIAGYTEDAELSRSATIEMDFTPSKGDVNILKLTAGSHIINIDALDQNLIFRFYISKSSVRINR